MTSMTRPPFLKSLLSSWQLTLEHGKARDLFPYWIIGSATLGALAAAYLPAKFWDGTEIDAAVSALGGLLTFNGIVMALCWSAFGKVYEIIGAGAFCAHLRKYNLLSHYLVFVNYCHLAQILAITCTAFALAAMWLPLQLWVVKVAVGGSIGSSIYAVIQGFSSSQVMQDLIWRKSEFDQGQDRGPMKAVGVEQ